MIKYKNGIVYGNDLDWIKKYTVQNKQYDKMKRMGVYAKRTKTIYTAIKSIAYYPKGILSLMEDWDYEYCGDIDNGKVNYKFDVDMWDDKQQILDWTQNKKQGLILAPTGFGKTVVQGALIKQKECKSIVIVPKVDIARKTYADFCEWFGEDQVCLFKKDKPLKNIVVIVGNSFNMYREQLSGEYDMLIVDEAHMNFITNSQKKKNSKFTDRMEIYALFKCKYFFGLTATPESDYVEDDVFELVFGKKYKVQNKPVLPMIVKYDYDDGMYQFLDWQDMLSTLYSITDRYKTFAGVVKEVMQGREMGIVFCDRIEVVENVCKYLRDEGIYCKEYTSKTQNREEILKDLENNKGVMVATYQTCGTGFDWKTLDTGFYFLSVKFKGTVKQMVGRILRKKEGKKQPILIDWVDKIIKHQYYQRRQAYKETYGYYPISWLDYQHQKYFSEGLENNL